MAIMSRHHLPLFSLCGVLFLLVGVMLLSYRIDTKYDYTESQGTVLRQRQSEIAVFNSSELPKSLAQVFGRRAHTWEFSSDRLHDKRALSDQFHCLIEKGKQYWEQGVLPAFDGQSRFPNPFFNGESQIQDQLLDSGWTSDDDNSRLGEHWKDAFRGIAGGLPDDNTDVIRIFLDQSQDFSNDYGEQQHPQPTTASTSPATPP
ncbi:MAG: hypothetical protein L6R38_008070 [Xanthoria sp. 2 TBL-2021]|nr:MAG: hypothetical protein L6R38_008070 [Xanthoria sp. 2 TBL-2021]